MGNFFFFFPEDINEQCYIYMKTTKNFTRTHIKVEPSTQLTLSNSYSYIYIFIYFFSKKNNLKYCFRYKKHSEYFFLTKLQIKLSNFFQIIHGCKTD